MFPARPAKSTPALRLFCLTHAVFSAPRRSVFACSTSTSISRGSALAFVHSSTGTSSTSRGLLANQHQLLNAKSAIATTTTRTTSRFLLHSLPVGSQHPLRRMNTSLLQQQQQQAKRQRTSAWYVIAVSLDFNTACSII